MSVVGVIGLGEIGGPIAARLIACGFDVVAFDPVADRAASAAAAGAKIAESPRAVTATADRAVILIVGTAAHAQTACSGEQGCISALGGKALIVMSTLDPDTVLELDRDAAASGGTVLDAPCGGGARVIPDGNLSIMASGAPEAFELGGEVLDALAGTVHVVGDRAGLGQVAKLLTQIALAINLTGLAEVIGIAKGYGMAQQAILDAVSSSSGRSWASAQFDMFVDSMRDHNVEIIHKDLRAIVGRAVERDLPVTLGSAAMEALRLTWPFVDGQ